MNPFPDRPRQPQPARSEAGAQIASEQARIDALLDELRARTDAVIDEQADRMERWQVEQEARFERALREQRAWFEQRLAELTAAADGAGGTVRQAAQRAVDGVEGAVGHAHQSAAGAVRALADARATIEQTVAEARLAAEQAIRQVQSATEAATLRARQSAASIEEGLAHHSANLALRAEDAVARASAVLVPSAGRTPHPAGVAGAQWIQRLEELIARAEQIAGVAAPDLAMPAHEAPAPWPPAPMPGSLPDLLARSQSVLTRSRTLINDLARQTRAGETVRDALERVTQDGAAAVGGQRDQVEQVHALVSAGFEAGFELEKALGGAIAEARRTAGVIQERPGGMHQPGQRLAGAGHSLRTAADGGEAEAA